MSSVNSLEENNIYFIIKEVSYLCNAKKILMQLRLYIFQVPVTRNSRLFDISDTNDPNHEKTYMS